MSNPEIEYYFYTYEKIIEGLTAIDYTQLYNKEYSSSFNNINMPSFSENSYTVYDNKNIQQNSNKTIGGTNLYTLVTNKGTIMFLLSLKNTYFVKDEKRYSKPVYTSGYYLGKNIEIIVEVLDSQFGPRKISVVFL